MDLNLEGKKALITGASKGIGAAVAGALAREGCDLILVSRSQDDLEQVAERLRPQTSVRTYSADLSDSSQLEAVAAYAGEMDILVNNAGAIPPGSIETVTEDIWRTAWDLKVFGYINLCRLAYARMRDTGGVIINIIGAAGEKPTASYIAGSSGNAALMALTKALGGTAPKDNVRVVGINPGLIFTERLENALRTQAERRMGDPDRWRELVDARYPPGQPEHIADLVAFLASDKSSNTTGTIVTCDGGYSAR